MTLALVFWAAVVLVWTAVAVGWCLLTALREAAADQFNDDEDHHDG